MENLIGKFTKKYHELFFTIFRVLVGLLFLQHGAQKLFGWFGSNGPVELFSLMGFVGTIEFLGGLAITFGLFTRLATVGTIIIMLSAYFTAHLPNGWIPIMNNGELALLFFAAFLPILVHGSGKISLDKLFFKKEFF